jgi:hypothetical protein
MSVCKEPELEKQLLKLFIAARQANRKINRRWFVRQGRQLYDQLYSHRVVKISERMIEYEEFKFSNE